MLVLAVRPTDLRERPGRRVGRVGHDLVPHQRRHRLARVTIGVVPYGWWKNKMNNGSALWVSHGKGLVVLLSPVQRIGDCGVEEL
jgi:hypothetical protein